MKLLWIGTFLEYFDLMLFVHMAVLLNEKFFPNDFSQPKEVLSAFAFCSTFLLKPFGGLFFGYIGDKLGRKSALLLSTAIMSISCIIIASIPEYTQIGVTASIIICICRALQGIASIGESIGAELYVSECIAPPERYIKVGLIGIAGVVGMVCSLIVAKIVISYGINWRVVFWIGSCIAIIGYIGRTNLVDSAEFEENRKDFKRISSSPSFKKNKNLQYFIRNTLELKKHCAYVFIFCGWPFCFYFSYIYCSDILKNQFSYKAEELISHNFSLSLINLAFLIGWVLLTQIIHPLKILRSKVIVLSVFMCFLPFLLTNLSSPFQLFIIQAIVIIFGHSTIPAKAIFLMHFPILRRFRSAAFSTGLAHVIVYLITSFGLVYSVGYFGYKGILFIFVPITMLFCWGLYFFIQLEKKTGDYYLDFRKKRNKLKEVKK